MGWTPPFCISFWSQGHDQCFLIKLTKLCNYKTMFDGSQSGVRGRPQILIMIALEEANLYSIFQKHVWLVHANCVLSLFFSITAL